MLLVHLIKKVNYYAEFLIYSIAFVRLVGV